MNPRYEKGTLRTHSDGIEASIASILGEMKRFFEEDMAVGEGGFFAQCCRF